ncbi:MAG TPA: T9SS type A sorting domain-containing protein [Chitinophagales bacterium]|nr:T9SS type A sorting domain-containing protein [Chitinophagales bacterium]
MKKITQLAFVLLFLFSAAALQAQISAGTYTIPGTVGATTVNNLTELATLLNANAVTGECIFEFSSNYTGVETFPVVFTNNAGTGRVVIRPAASVSTALVTSGVTTAFALIDFNHGHDITFDGRPGGQGSSIMWQFKNTQASSTFPVFRFINNAYNDTLQYLDIKCSGSSSSSTILISTSNTGTGNKYDVIQNCKIGNNAAASYTAIYANGSASPNHNGFITIKDNEIYNFMGFSNGPPTNGGIVVTATGNTGGDWKITGNSFYSTLTTTGSFLTGIYFAPGVGATGNVISGNYIGGRGPQGGTAGTPWVFNGYRGYTSYTDFTGIYALGANTVSNNTIQNVRLSNPNSGSQTFSGINIGGASVTTVSGNTVGSATDTSSVHAGGMGVVVGIWNQSTGAVTIDNNTIANLTSDAAYPPTGSTNGDVIGIYNYSSGLLGSSTTTNNRVFNLSTANANSTNQYFPISAGGGISSQQIGSYSRNVMAGICMQTAGNTNHIISNNSIHGLRTTYGTGGNTCYLYGIVPNGGTGTITVDGNEVYGLYAPNNIGNAGNFVGLTGIYLPTSSLGKYTITNNIISLGLRPTDGTSVQNALISGIWDNTNNNNVNLKLKVYHNSVYIGGTNSNTYSNNLNSYAFRRMLIYGSSVYDSLVVLNNIFVNNRSTSTGTGKNYGTYFNSTLSAVSNYNDIYGTGTNFVYTNVGGSDYTTLNIAQLAGTGFDGNSISADPLYNSLLGTAPDLHIPLNSPANQAGTPGLTTTIDFDGAIRANYTPVDLGATVAGGAIPCTPTTGSITASACGSYTSPSGDYTWTSSGTYTDTLTNAAGCDSIVTINLTINSIPTASITPVSVTICNGGSATLTAGGGGTYAWSNGLGSNALVSVSPTSQTTYTVTVTGANTCTATASKTVSVNQLPNAGINGANAVCTGSSTQLTATGGASYSWSNSLGSNAQVSVAPTSQTTYTVTVTDGNSCTATASKTVTVNQLPAVTANASATTVCAGTAVTLNGSNAATYVWNNGVSNGIAFAAVNTTTYTVTGTDANNCSATASVTVNVNTLPNAAISGPTTICAGLQATLTASGGTGYSWSNSLGTNAQVTVTPVNPTTYTVTVTDGNNCSATAAHTVTVTNAPVASITGATQSCAGESVTLTADGGNTYTWADGLGTNASITASPTSTTTYTVTATVGANCSATATHTVTVYQPATSQFSQSICSGESYVYNGVSLTAGGTYLDTLQTINGCDSIVTLNLTVNQLPAATITAATNTNFCTGDDVMLSAPAGTVTYLWSNGETTQSITVNSSGAYSVTVTGTGNCTAVSAPEIVTAFPLPAVPVITRENDTLISTPSAGYQWYFNNTILDGSTDPKLTITQNGPYYVEVSDTNGCTNRSATYNAISVSVKDVAVMGGVKLYPNPNSGSFVIEFSDAAEREVEIMDVIGQVVYSNRLSAKLNSINADLSAGIYLIRLNQNGNWQSMKVTITR